MTTGQARRLVLVIGVGRSGTSLLAGILGQAGLHIPQPEVQADGTNPRGFGEPRWVVDLHTRLLRQRRVTVNDSRPTAWESTGAAAAEEDVRGELRAWLGEQFREADAVVVKDPRTVWFLPLWLRCAAEVGVLPAFATMLRHPAEVLTSAKRSYGLWQTDASRAAAWLNVILESERATRAAPRAFVPYERLLGDWESESRRVGEALDLAPLRDLDRSRLPQVDAFVDPALHRVRVRWDALEVPDRVEEMCESVWRELAPLTEPGGDTPARRATLDEARAAFASMYAEAEAIAQSSVTAAKPRRKRAPAGAARTDPAPSLRVRLARRVPIAYRRRLRRALHSLSVR